MRTPRSHWRAGWRTTRRTTGIARDRGQASLGLWFEDRRRSASGQRTGAARTEIAAATGACPRLRPSRAPAPVLGRPRHSHPRLSPIGAVLRTGACPRLESRSDLAIFPALLNHHIFPSSHLSPIFPSNLGSSCQSSRSARPMGTVPYHPCGAATAASS